MSDPSGGKAGSGGSSSGSRQDVDRGSAGSGGRARPSGGDGGAPSPLAGIVGLANPYDAGDSIALSVVQDPPTAFSSYGWFRWNGGKYVRLPGDSASESFVADTSGQYVAALLTGSSGRIVAMAYADVAVNP